MASIKPSREASPVEDAGVDIERWQQAATIVRKDEGIGTGPIGLLFNSIVELLGLILIDMKTRPNISEQYQSLETSSAALFFWGTDLGVSRGELDKVLQDSYELRDTCLLVLVSIGQFIVFASAHLLSSKDQQKDVLDSTSIVVSLEQAMHILGQSQHTASQVEQDEETLCRTLRMKVDTLVMLGPSLESPAPENFDNEEPRAIGNIDEHLPEQVYINSVAERFPLAERTVVNHLGKLNWERYNHMIRLQHEAVDQELGVIAMEKAKTIFHDSGLGTSVPAQSEAGLNIVEIISDAQSIHAPSIISSRAEASHRRLSPLPPQARSGDPFTCAICNRTVVYRRTKAWKKHIFDDILAYACIFTECSVVDVFFEDRDAMMRHLEERHGMDVAISEVTCPLCLEYTTGDRDALLLHLARHMEEIALAILPSGVDSDDESATDTPSRFGSQMEKNLSDDEELDSDVSRLRNLIGSPKIPVSTNENSNNNFESITDRTHETFGTLNNSNYGSSANYDDEVALEAAAMLMQDFGAKSRKRPDDSTSKDLRTLDEPERASQWLRTQYEEDSKRDIISTYLDIQQFQKDPIYTRRRSDASLHVQHSGTSRKSEISYEIDDETREKGLCPLPECGRVFKDLKAHMLTHQNERPEKCPIATCEYHLKGFSRKYDRNRHTLMHYKDTMVCGFCPRSSSAAEKSFNRVDVFKRHLTSIHGIEQNPPNSHKESPAGRKIYIGSQSMASICSTCSVTFANAQEFYEHLDDCVLRVVQQAYPNEAINQHLLTSVAQDNAVTQTLHRNGLPNNIEHAVPSNYNEDEDEDGASEENTDADNANNDTCGVRRSRSGKILLEQHFKENHRDISERRYNFPTEEEISSSMNNDLPKSGDPSDMEYEVEEDES